MTIEQSVPLKEKSQTYYYIIYFKCEHVNIRHCILSIECVILNHTYFNFEVVLLQLI